MIYGITLIFLSILAVPKILTKRKPESEDLINKVKPFQGIIGIVFCVIGLFETISFIGNMKLLKASFPLWVTLVIGSAYISTLGFILGYNLIQDKLLSKNEKANQTGKKVISKLSNIQSKLGLYGIILGIFIVIMHILY